MGALNAAQTTVTTAGVDLAAENKGTALAIIEWTDEGAHLQSLLLGASDAAIIKATDGVCKLGIDCAFGWPDEFVHFVTQHSSLHDDGPEVDGGMDWRRTLAYRETDRVAREVTGRWPLSVSTDRLGLTAMRCAGLLGRLAASSKAIDRTGAGYLVEVYPGATLRLWGFDTTGYRTSPDQRQRLHQAITSAAPWLEFGSFTPLMVESSDAFDSVIAALAARNADLGFYRRPTPEQADRAAREGWIALPDRGLADLQSG